MKFRSVSPVMIVFLLASLLATIPIIPMASAVEHLGPKTDVLRGKVIRSPDAQLLAMQTDEADVSPDLIRTSDIETYLLDDRDFLITQNLGFHMGYIAYNIRADQSYRRTDLALGFWPLADVEFRHALIHGYDQLGIVASIYGYIATPVRSLVPPAQAYWYNPAVPEHPFNLGDPFTSPPGEHSTAGILKAADYTFVDVDNSGTVTDVDYWNDPNGNPLPKMVIWTPIGPCGLEDPHGKEFVNDLGTVGLKATAANGDHGMIAEGAEFNWYLSMVFDYADFDGYMLFWGLGRFPNQLYDLLHSRMDPIIDPPGTYNAAGIADRELDDLLETMMFTLPPPPGQPDVRREAAFEVQERVYNPTYDYALAYMMLYSRTYFNAFDQNLRGIVKSPGYGSDNKWTWLNAHWAPGTERIEDGKTVINYIVAEEPGSFNPTYATKVHEWFYMDNVMDDLMAINPYNHRDFPWIATDWQLAETPNGPGEMNITYTLRNDVFWQDGRHYTAHDAAFNLLFLRDWQIPRYSSIWGYIVDVVVHDDYSFTVVCSETNWMLLYDLADVAAMLPPQIWDKPWADLQAILDYDPTEPYNVAPGYTAGPHPPPTNLFGTGPWIFQFYDTANLYGDLWANPSYFMTTTDIDNLLTEIFHEVGDVNEDGEVWGIDYWYISTSFGTFAGEPDYNPNADLDQNGIVDMMDLATAAFYSGWRRESPKS